MQKKRDRDDQPTPTLSRRTFLTSCAAGAAAVGMAPTVLAAALRTVTNPVVDANASYCRFGRLAMRDYGTFRGLNELRFTAGLNVILGCNGSGKTTLFEALAHSDSPPTPRAHLGIPNPQMSLAVETLGNPELLRRHRDLIFLDDDHLQIMREPPWWLRSDDSARLEEDARRIYLQWMPHRESRLGGLSLRLDMWNAFGVGDVTLMALAYVFAARNRLGLDLPLVMERPFQNLDSRQREELAGHLRQLPDQVILLVTESELSGHDEMRPQWYLARGKKHSRILSHAEPGFHDAMV